VLSGWLRLWAGQPELPISHFETSLRLHARRAGTFMAIGVCHFFARRFEDAAAMLLRSVREHPGWAPTYRLLAACYAHMGRLDDAREVVKRLRAITPVVVPSGTQFLRNTSTASYSCRACVWLLAKRMIHSHPRAANVSPSG
jgi:pentatricopeptide repeat protein